MFDRYPKDSRQFEIPSLSFDWSVENGERACEPVHRQSALQLLIFLS